MGQRRSGCSVPLTESAGEYRPKTCLLRRRVLKHASAKTPPPQHVFGAQPSPKQLRIFLITDRDDEGTRASFERAIVTATRPLNGQLPRPWMTDLADPISAELFIVGRNPARTYDAATTSHERHVDALFNRRGQSCRGLYDELADGASSTRKNIDVLNGALGTHGVTRILETNVICYSSPMSADLARPEHASGADAGKAMFRFLLDNVRPRVLIAHGVGTVDDLGRALGVRLPNVPTEPRSPVHVEIDGILLILIPSLAPPAWQRWQRWALPHLHAAAELAAQFLEGRRAIAS